MTKFRYNPCLKERARYLRNHPTFTEKLLWHYLKGKKLKYDFHRQKPLGSFIFDLYCYKLNLVIEIDGITHVEPDVKENDKMKDKYISEAGLQILRFTDEEVLQNCDKVINRIKEYIEEFEKGCNIRI